MSSAPAALAGGRYTVVRRLAQGGMGEVLLADFPGDAALGLSAGLVVVKRVLAEHPNRAHQAAMLREEGRVGLRLLHENLVETFFVDEDEHREDEPLLVMEFMSGRAMSQVLGQAKKRKEHVPLEVALAILRAAACGLHFAHTLTDAAPPGVAGRPLGLIHRDVSPANLFVTFDGRVKVIDFGVAKADDSEIRTSTGILKGKLGYMSPEHALGEKLSPSADLWSLGVCFWESLCAERLFSMASPSATLSAIAEKPIPSPLRLRPDLPSHVVELCMWLLERRLDRRLSTGAALVKAIDALPEAPALGGVDLGGWLAGRFPDEAAQGTSEAARCARLARRTPVPLGLVEGRAAAGPDVVADEADDGADDGATRVVAAPEPPMPTGDDARGVSTEPLPRAPPPARPDTVRIELGVDEGLDPGLDAGLDPGLDDVPAPAPARSWVAVAVATFGVLAVAMGVSLSLLSPRATVRTIAAYDDGGAEVLVAPRDAPAGARAIDIAAPRLRVAVRADELTRRLAEAGVLERAALPRSARAKLALLLPLLIAGAGALALALAAPALATTRAGRGRLVVQLALALVCVGALALVVQRGALSWPGLQAWRSVPRLEMR